jgi:hypothetical protein
MAIATRDMTGLLSDAPELAAQVARLAALRRETAASSVHGRFLDTRGLRVEGGRGFVYASDAGTAVTLANPLPEEATVSVGLSPEEIGLQQASHARFHAEGAQPVVVSATEAGLVASFEVRLPPYGAGVLVLPEER